MLLRSGTRMASGAPSNILPPSTVGTSTSPKTTTSTSTTSTTTPMTSRIYPAVTFADTETPMLSMGRGRSLSAERGTRSSLPPPGMSSAFYTAPTTHPEPYAPTYTGYQHHHHTPTIGDIAAMVPTFSGISNQQEVETWLHSFHLYTSFKKMDDSAKLDLFKLMLRDQAALWLRTIPPESANTLSKLLEAFRDRYAMTPAQKWRKTAEIWSCQQAPTEDVGDYIARMQLDAQRVQMPTQSLLDAVIKGLKAPLRTFVLQNSPTSLEEVRRLATTASASIDDHDENATLAAELRSLIAEFRQQKFASDTAQQTASRRVSFAQAAIANDRYDEVSTRQQSTSPHHRRSMSPVASGATPSRYDERAERYHSPGGSYRQDDRRAGRDNRSSADNGHRQYRIADDRATDNWQRRDPRPTTPNNRGQTSSSTCNQRTNRGNLCFCCGRDHQRGREFCPARQVRCRACHKLGHFEAVCRNVRHMQNNYH